MNAPARHTGIDVIGDVPWGTHLCQLYRTRQDLIDVLVPYFRRGLADRECCVWVTSQPLDVDQATAALRAVVPALDEYLRSGQIQILDHAQWYTPSAQFDAGDVLRRWVDQLQGALDRGYEGLRLAGSTFWPEGQASPDLASYEEAVNRLIRSRRILALCTYPLDECGPHQVIDLVGSHRCALVEQSGRWQVVESGEQRETQATLRESEQRPARAQAIAHLGSGERDLSEDELRQANERLQAENEARLRTERDLRLEQSRLDALLELSRLTRASVAEIANFILEHSIALTGSKIGFVGFLSEDETVYTLHAVSKAVVQECDVAGDPVRWHIAEAGLWADAIRRRKTVLINDYSQPYPGKKGLPPGHPPVQRFMAVPAFDGKRIVAIAGVGNKATDYDRADERQVALLLAGMWNHVQRNRARQALQRAHDELEHRVEQRTAQLAASNVALEQQIAERVRAEEALRQYAERLHLQRQIDRAILSSRSAGEMAEAVLRRLPHLLPCQRAGVNLVDPQAKEVWLLATYSAGETSLAKGWRAPVAEALGEAVAQLARGEPFLVDDVQALDPSSPLTAQLQAEGVRAQVLQPLIVQGELIGTLRIGMRVPGPLPAEQLETISELADALAVGIQQMHLYEQVQRYAAELEQRVRLRTAELVASEARFRAVYEQAAIGIALLDRAGRILSSNPALQRMLGYSAQQLAGLPLSALAGTQEPRSTSPPAGGIEGGEKGGPSSRVEQRYRRQDGGTILANVTTSPIHLYGEQARLSVALIEDVTERAQAQEALRQSERLALTGRLAASVAHEIGNPLQAVIGCLGLALQIPAGDARHERYMQLAIEELDRVTHLVGRMRDLTRRSDGELQRVDVDALVDKVLLLNQKHCQDRRIAVHRETGQDLPVVVAVPDHLQQVLLNLVLNAVDAMPGGGELSVRTAATAGPAGVEVILADTGSGIPPEQLERLFEPFASTKAQGLGLGLYVSHTIVRQHGGRIDVQSEVGQGTTFTVWLPAEH